MDKLTETTVSSVDVYTGALLNVKKDLARLPDGETGVREWIKHPGASAVVPLFENGDTVMVKQFRYAPRRTFLEVPAGKLDAVGEAPESVARRELEEETGFVAGTVLNLGSFYPCIGYSDEVIHLFLATNLTEGAMQLSDGEFIEVVRLPLVEAVRRARCGELADMKSVVALIRVAEQVGI